MKEFIRKHEGHIHGVLSCFDRMLFRGYLPIMSGWSMGQWRNSSMGQRLARVTASSRVRLDILRFSDRLHRRFICVPAGTIPRTQSAKVSRAFRRSHAHGLIAKIPRTRRWRVTAYGRQVMEASFCLRDHVPNGYSRIAA